MGRTATASLSSWRAWIEIQCIDRHRWPELSLSSWRAWIEIESRHGVTQLMACRSPHGERGLKFIEFRPIVFVESRSPHGERGLKWSIHCEKVIAISRSPHGERGLKSRTKAIPPHTRSVALLMESVD